jgi:hypothetical protein
MNKELAQKLFTYKDGNLFWKSKYSIYSSIKIGQQAGFTTSEGYVNIKVAKKIYPIHRIIFLYHHGYLPKFIDHINKIKNDNRIENLRPATASENQHNKKIQKNNKSGIKGVCWSTSNKKWQVQLMVNKKAMHFGYYFDIKIAEFIAETMRNKYHKSFSCSY